MSFLLPSVLASLRWQRARTREINWGGKRNMLERAGRRARRGHGQGRHLPIRVRSLPFSSFNLEIGSTLFLRYLHAKALLMSLITLSMRRKICALRQQLPSHHRVWKISRCHSPRVSGYPRDFPDYGLGRKVRRMILISLQNSHGAVNACQVEFAGRQRFRVHQARQRRRPYLKIDRGRGKSSGCRHFCHARRKPHCNKTLIFTRTDKWVGRDGVS